MSTDVVLEVIILRPKFGNYHHWGLHIWNIEQDANYVFQADGEEHNLKREVAKVNPRRSRNLIKSIMIGKVSSSRLSESMRAINGVGIQNEISTWDCQEYVFDIIDVLGSLDFLGVLPKYRLVKGSLKSMRGDPIQYSTL